MSDFQYTGTDTLEIMEEAKNYNAFLERLVLKYVPNKEALILDIGAGIGTFAKKISLTHPNIHCIEPDVMQSQQIKKLNLPVDTTIENIKNNSVDFIYALNVLEHIKDDQDTVKTWAEKLKPGGRIFIYVPAFQILYSAFDKSVEHYRRYNKAMLVDIFKKNNLQIEEAKYVDSIGFFVALMYKWIYKNGKINVKSLIIYDRFLFPVSRLCDILFHKLFGKNVYIVGKKMS